MESPWDIFLSATSKETEQMFPDTPFPTNPKLNKKDDPIERELEIYLKLSKEGRSFLKNLKDRKEFFRPDLYKHLLEGVLSKDFPKAKGTNS